MKVVLKPQKSHSLAKFLYSSVKYKPEVSAQTIWVKFYGQFMQEVKWDLSIPSRSKPCSSPFYLDRNTRRMATAPVFWPFLSKSKLQKGNIRGSNKNPIACNTREECGITHWDQGETGVNSVHCRYWIWISVVRYDFWPPFCFKWPWSLWRALSKDTVGI